VDRNEGMRNGRLTRARFETTCWELLGRPGDAEALGSLAVTYWAPVYAYVRRTGRSPDEAADLTQGFIAEVLLGRDLPGRADRQRGRFRWFLMTALDRYLKDRARRERARTAEGRPVPLDAAAMECQGRPGEDVGPEEAFERQWAASVLEQALERVRADCERDGMGEHWRAFEARVLGPALRRGPEVPLATVAEELDTPPERVSAMVHSVKRRLRRVFVDVVAATVPGTGEELEDEVRRLKRWLGL